jgi:hypothetical protein
MKSLYSTSGIIKKYNLKLIAFYLLLILTLTFTLIDISFFSIEYFVHMDEIAYLFFKFKKYDSRTSSFIVITPRSSFQSLNSENTFS